MRREGQRQSHQNSRSRKPVESQRKVVSFRKIMAKHNNINFIILTSVKCTAQYCDHPHPFPELSHLPKLNLCSHEILSPSSSASPWHLSSHFLSESTPPGISQRWDHAACGFLSLPALLHIPAAGLTHLVASDSCVRRPFLFQAE